jgi:MFS family permease
MADQEQVFAKCARRMIPFMMLLYVTNYLDRVNVGFAALTMNQDLGFSASVYGFAAGVFFISYAMFQIPANVLLERIGAGTRSSLSWRHRGCFPPPPPLYANPSPSMSCTFFSAWRSRDFSPA